MKKEIKYLMIVALVVSGLALAGVLTLFGSKVVTNENEKTIQKTTENPSYPLVSNLVAAHSFVYGPADAKVTVIEFFDPECESCAAVSPYIKKEMKFYEGKVRWVFRYMPYHRNSKAALAALEAARKQNLFLEAMEQLFVHQKVWGEKQEATNEEINKIILSINGINKNKYLKDLADQNIENLLKQDEAEGKQAGVKGTPTFFVNGVIMEQLDLDALISKINSELGK
ncbi:disulfide bond formation protein DsbA [Bdellovibrio sp. qaytius]|nr:disulfide bond formation protein DsbA [Bdellovibrio sp. qaytius]